MKFIKIIVLIIVIFFGIVWAISSYLGVDDLKHCDATPSSKKGCGAADAIVAISGGDTSARTSEAIKLYKNGWGNILIFSGAAADRRRRSTLRSPPRRKRPNRPRPRQTALNHRPTS